ncbi:TPTE2 isoform 5 [Pongo abelii]|uniref:TPTE2 isoform 2 n=1 Tax=Pongo abelii TaxID=9601 RepID=A0A2J8QZJ5_PONAB|nr:TPTE2 isoform 2 [Pongo abelii]PNJ01688.1 TPTE2 isoform 5 [Pongo abelii]
MNERIFGVFLVLLDVTLLLADLIFTDSKLYIPLDYRSISLAIALFFLMDVLLRVFVEGVARFLDKKHPNHYRVYNLCRRTGTMVCALLIAFEIFLTAEESLYYFGERRTDKTHSNKFQGVETPSQNRYVGYFAQVKHLYNWNLPPRQILFIKRFIIYSIRGDVCDLEVQIVMEKKVVFSSTSLGNCSILHDIETDKVLIDVFDGPLLYDDVKVQFFSSNLPKYYDNCPFFFWFNTSFIQNNRLYLPRNELDNPHKQKAWKIYPSEFAVEILFGEK